MLYNQDGSDFYKLAKKFANRFEEKFNKVKMDEVRPREHALTGVCLPRASSFLHSFYDDMAGPKTKNEKQKTENKNEAQPGFWIQGSLCLFFGTRTK